MTIILKNEAGFTLIELMVVMILLALWVGISAPIFRRSAQGWNGELAVQDILALMTFAHERAILERTEYAVHLAPEERAFWLLRRAEDNAGSDLARMAGKWGVVHHLPKGVELKGAEASVVFYPDGTSSEASWRLLSPDRGGTLVMDPVTGKGLVHEAS